MSFDPQAFLSNTVVEGAMETKYVNAPPGEHQAQIQDYGARTTKNKDGSESTIVDLKWGIFDETVCAATGMTPTLVRQSIFLDISPQGGLANGPGKNVQLGRVREALKQNDPGKQWNFPMLKGAWARIKVEHSPNEKDPTNPYANVTAVAPI